MKRVNCPLLLQVKWVGGHSPELHIFPDEVSACCASGVTFLSAPPSNTYVRSAETQTESVWKQEGDDTIVEKIDLTISGSNRGPTLDGIRSLLKEKVRNPRVWEK